jgi:putative oligomerization/nucleic acid binding protein
MSRREQDAEQDQAAQPAPAPAAPDQTAKLKELADLHASGALTDEEFAAAKAKLLGL